LAKKTLYCQETTHTEKNIQNWLKLLVVISSLLIFDINIIICKHISNDMDSTPLIIWEIRKQILYWSHHWRASAEWPFVIKAWQWGNLFLKLTNVLCHCWISLGNFIYYCYSLHLDLIWIQNTHYWEWQHGTCQSLPTHAVTLKGSNKPCKKDVLDNDHLNYIDPPVHSGIQSDAQSWTDGIREIPLINWILFAVDTSGRHAASAICTDDTCCLRAFFHCHFNLSSLKYLLSICNAHYFAHQNRMRVILLHNPVALYNWLFCLRNILKG